MGTAPSPTQTPPLPPPSMGMGTLAPRRITLTLNPPPNPPPNPPLTPPLTLTRNPSRSEEWKEEADSKLAAKEEEDE